MSDVYARAASHIGSSIRRLQSATYINRFELKRACDRAGLAIVDAANPAAPVTDEGFVKLVDELLDASLDAVGAYTDNRDIYDIKLLEAAQVQAARTRVLTAHAEAIKAAEARGMERAAEIADDRGGYTAADIAAAIRAASKTGEAS